MAIQAYHSQRFARFSFRFGFGSFFLVVAFYAFSVIFLFLIFHIFTFSCAQIQLAKINIAHTPRCLNNINY